MTDTVGGICTECLSRRRFSILVVRCCLDRSVFTDCVDAVSPRVFSTVEPPRLLKYRALRRYERFAEAQGYPSVQSEIQTLYCHEFSMKYDFRSD